MPREYPLEIRYAAEERYVVDGWTYEECAREYGVSLSQIKNWAKDDAWRERRAEYRDTVRSIKAQSLELRRRFVEKALHSLDPQDVYAVARLEAAAAKAAAPEKPPAEPVDIDSPADIAAHLERAVELRLGELVSGTRKVDFKAVKDLKRAADYLQELRAGTDAPKAGADLAAVAEKIEDLLNL
jgi:hypothetical protein